MSVDPCRRRFALWLGGLWAVALAVRLAYLWEVSGSPLWLVVMGDARAYDAWARRLAAGDWLGGEVFYQAPLYPYFLGAVYATFCGGAWTVRLVQCLLGATACVLLAVAGRRFVNRPVGLTAGGMLAAYPPAVFSDGLIQKTALTMFLLCLSLCLAGGLRRRPGSAMRWFAFGATVGLLALVRENALVLAALAPAWALIAFRPFGRRRLGWAAAFLAGVAAMLAPVAARNGLIGGEWHLTTSQFGPNFYIGNNAAADGLYAPLVPERGDAAWERLDATALAEKAEGRPLSPREVSRYWTRQALAETVAAPGHWLRLLARKLWLTCGAFEIMDAEDQYTYAEYSRLLAALMAVWHMGVLAPLAAFGAALLLPERRWRSRLAWPALAAAGYTASVLLFFVLGRYRMPLVPPLMLFAAAGLWEAAGIAPRAIARARSGGRGWTGASRRQPENTGKPRTAGGWGRCARSDDLETSANASPPAERPSAHRWGRAERPYPVSRVEGRPDPSRPSGASALGIQPLGGRAVLGRLSVALAVSAITAVPVNVAPYPVGDAKAVTRENLGDHLYRAGFPHDLVLEQYERAVALTPDSPPLRRHYAKVLWDMGRRDAARQQLETLLARHPDDVPTLVDLGLLLRDEKRFAPAIDRLRAAVSAAPDWPEPRYQLAVALLKWADHLAAGAAAVALEDTSVSSERNDIVAGLKKTEALRREAVSQLRRGLELDPDSEPAHAALGTALAALGEKEEAAQEFGAAAELAPPGSERQARLRSAAQRLEPSPKARPRDLDGVGR